MIRRLLPLLLLLALVLPVRAQPPALQLETLAGPLDLDPSLPRLDALLGFPWGERPADGDAILAACQRLASASPRVSLLHYGQTWEGRPLVCAAVSSPENIARLETLRAAHVARMRGADTGDDLPLVLWIGASVHGDETSGADAALGLLALLAADRGRATAGLLERAIVLIDPLQNPDGRARFMARWRAWGGPSPVLDDQDLGHRGEWPPARGNHYLQDLNRDWFTLSQPETRGRVALFLDWYPAMSVDLHEMASSATTLFSPPREPDNPHLPAATRGWWQTLGDAVAQAFGRRGWPCVTGDWNEEFSPNRGGSWPLHLGTVAILAEQASSDGGAVLRPDGQIMDYPDTVARQCTVAWTLLRTAADSAEALAADQRASRRAWKGVAADGTRLYLVDASRRPEAARDLAERLTAQGIRVDRTRAPLRLDDAVDAWGERRGGRAFPAGSYVVDLDQPEGRLAAAVLELDPSLPDSFLTRERRSLERGGGTLLYEAAAWSPALAGGVDVYRSSRRVELPSEPLAAAAPGGVSGDDAPLGFLLRPDSPGAIDALAALLGERVHALASQEAFARDGQEWPAGTVYLPRRGNGAALGERLAAIARATGAEFVGVDQALSTSGPDLGSSTWRRLGSPRVALLAGSPFYATSFGALWQHLERDLGLAVTRLDFDQLDTADLDRYTVILVPDAGNGRGASLRGRLGGAGWTRLEAWVRRGGTLIATGEGTGLLFPPPDEAPWGDALGALRPRRQVLDQVDSLLDAGRRLATLDALRVDGAALRAGDSTAVRRAPLPAASIATTTPEYDAWLRRFAPGGAILRVDLNARHWLSAGVGDRVPAMVNTDLALLSLAPESVVGRFAPPPSLRLAGVLWPEARWRWAETVYLSQERVGDGQVIAFLGNPAYRGAFRGTLRLLDNALLLGPGLGTRPRPPVLQD